MAQFRIRGLLSKGYSLFFRNKGYRYPIFYQCHLFTLKYCPPQHYLTLFQKSYPVAMNFEYPINTDPLIFNIKVSDVSHPSGNSKQLTQVRKYIDKYFRGANPFKYACLRNRSKRFVLSQVTEIIANGKKHELANTSSNSNEASSKPNRFSKNNLLNEEDIDKAYHGVFLFRFSRCPSEENFEQFKEHLQIAFRKVKKLLQEDLYKLKRGVKLSNKDTQIPFKNVVRQCILDKDSTFNRNFFGFVRDEDIDIMKNNLEKNETLSKELLLKAPMEERMKKGGLKKILGDNLV